MPSGTEALISPVGERRFDSITEEREGTDWKHRRVSDERRVRSRYEATCLESREDVDMETAGDMEKAMMN